VIDMQKIRRESEAVKSIEQQIQEQKSAYQKDLSEKEKEIREENQSLSKQRTLLAEDVFEKKRQNLRKKLGNFRRDIQTRRKALDQNYSEAMRRVQKKLIEVVRQVASERNLDVVLNKGTVVLVRPDMEITEIALQRLNDQLTSVDVPNIQE
jgi:Skp family chaperone for outer membrane proteins